MRYDLSNEYDIPKFKDACDKLLEQGGWVELKRVQERRSRPQNNYLHLLLGWYACEYGTTLEEVKVDVYKRLCNRDLFERERINGRGQTIKFLRSSSDLTKEEMTLSIERFRNYASAEAGIYLPAPNENQFLQHIEREMDRCKEYI